MPHLASSVPHHVWHTNSAGLYYRSDNPTMPPHKATPPQDILMVGKNNNSDICLQPKSAKVLGV